MLRRAERARCERRLRRAERPSRTSSPSGGRSSSGCARRASSRSRTRSRASSRDRRGPRRPRGPRAPARRPTTRYRVAGRLAARRGQGKAAFLDLVDRSGRIQLHARDDVLGEESFERLRRPRPRRHHRRRRHRLRHQARRAVAARRRLDAAGQGLRPPPDKYHGLEDVETPLPPPRARPDRQRGGRASCSSTARERSSGDPRAGSTSSGFVEVETPVLQPLYGGALARPFTTHHNALDRDLYLRIATELYLKRLIVGGLERVYELGKDFRNEGISPKHNPEFTMLEWYEAYADYDDVAERLEQLVAHVAERSGTSATHGRDRLRAAVAARDARATRSRERTGIDVLAHREPRGAAPRRCGARASTADRGRWAQLVDDLLSKHVEPELDPADVRARLPGRAVAVRQAPPLRARGWSSASRRSPAGWRSPTRSPSSTTPTSSARRFEEQRADAAARRRGGAAVRRGLRRGARARACRRPAGSGIGIDRLVMLLTGRATRSARSCCSPRCATEPPAIRADRHRGRCGQASSWARSAVDMPGCRAPESDPVGRLGRIVDRTR